MHSVLKPFVEELSLLSTKGFKTTDNKHRRAHCIIVAGDLKYLEKMDEKLAVGTYRVCRYCNIWGHRGGALSQTTYYPITFGNRYNVNRYDIYDVSGTSVLRKKNQLMEELKYLEEIYLNGIKSKLSSEQKRIGFKRFPILFNVPSLCLTESICIDSMHLVSGIAKTIFETVCGIEKVGKAVFFGRDFSLSKEYWVEAHCEVEKMKVPYFWGRRPTTPLKKGNMKATEAKFFLLHLLLPILYSKNVPLKFCKPFSRLSFALKWFLDKIGTSNDDLDAMQEYLVNAYQELEELIIDNDSKYLSFCTSNMHNLLHLGKCFRDFGGLFVYSQWALESKLGILRNYVTRKYNPEAALVKNVLLLNQLQLIGSIRDYDRSKEFRTSVNISMEHPYFSSFDYLPTASVANAIKAYLITQLEIVPNTHNHWLDSIKNPEALAELVNNQNWDELEFIYYKRMKFNGNTINSVKELTDSPKSYNSSFVRVEELIDLIPHNLQTSDLVAASCYYEIQFFLIIQYVAAREENSNREYGQIPAAVGVQYEIDRQNQTKDMKEMGLNG